VDPFVSTQWILKMSPLAEQGLPAGQDGRSKIVPERFAKVYYNWLENIRDWCISRQLWWGHRIPVWYCGDCEHMIVAREDPTACEKCGGSDLEQDPDVLDTWFSSGLWPFSTLGWPEETEDYKRYYPTDVMETGYDILFFWVARMIMQGLAMTDQIPFHTVYLHGLVRDGQGRKMSKTTGNVIDPLEMMDQYGTDALRFTLLTGSTPGNDMSLSEERIIASRNFANKIWNATRFVVSNQGAAFDAGQGTWNLSALALPDRWIMSRLNGLIQNVTQLMDAYQYGEAGRQIHDFLWGEYADWYIEIAKIRLYGADARAQATARRVLVYVLDRTLRMLHPFMPFVSEAAWQHLPHGNDSLMTAAWPGAGAQDKESEAAMELVMDAIRAIRNARAEYGVQPARRIDAYISAGEQYDLFSSQRDVLTELARLEANSLRIARSLPDKPEQALTLVVSGVEIYLPLAGMVDLDAERTRLRRELEHVENGIANSQKLLGNEGFTARAPAEVVQKERDKLMSLQQQSEKLHERLAALSA
jgi:valyl-tRNA synthetase